MLDANDEFHRFDVWESMADHFLDTETRHDIPRTALFCVRAGLSISEARDVWRYEVTPAVSFNLWDVAGEWAGWDREWLLARMRQVRCSQQRPRPLRWLSYRASVHFNHSVWIAIERCIGALLRVGPTERELLTEDLTALARHYFDFGPRGADAPTLERLRGLYPLPFSELLAPALMRTERRAADLRVRAVLDAT